MMLKDGPPIPLVRSPIRDTFASNSRLIRECKCAMGHENGAKKSAEREIYLKPRIRNSLSEIIVSSFSFILLIRATYASVHTATHAAHKRAVIPTERGAQVRIIFIRLGKRHVRAISEGSAQSEEFKSVQARAARIFRNTRLRKMFGLGYERLSASIWWIHIYVRSPRTRNESLPEQGRIVRRSLRLSSLAGCPFFTRSLSPFACSSLLPLSLPSFGSPTLPFFSSFNSIFFFFSF